MSTSPHTGTHTALRDADPAAGLSIDPASDGAQELLRSIVSTPREIPPGSTPALVPSRRRRTRLVVAAGAVAAAAVAAVAVPVFWPGSSAPGAAYAVTRHQDGSVRVTMNLDRFRDPRGLQRSLDRQHIRAVVLVGQGNLVLVGPLGESSLDETPACAVVHVAQSELPGNPYTDPNGPLSYNQARRWDHVALRLRPQRLPTDSTVVITVDLDHGQVRGFSGLVVRGTPPSCLYNG